MNTVPLRVALLANAGFWAAWGAWGLATGAAGVPVGATLLALAGAIIAVSARLLPHAPAVVAVGAANLGCLAGLSMLHALGHPLTGEGALALAGIAIVALLFTAALGIALAAMAATTRGRYRVCVVHTAGTDAAGLWTQVADVGAIARHARGLRSSRLLPPASCAVPVRECTDRAGRTWRERCRVDEGGRVLRVELIPDASGRALPFASMCSTWSVQARGDGCEVRIRWEFAPRRAWAAPLLLARLAWQADRAIPRMLAGMAAARAGEADARPGRRTRRRAAAC